jgi:hypothetical protein
MTAKTDRAPIRHPMRGVAAAALLVVAVISGCASRGGSVSAGAGAGAGAGAASGASSPSVVEAEVLFDEIASGMLGSTTRADAVRFLEHVGYQTLIIDCMASQGFIYKTDPAFRVPSRVARFGGGMLDPVNPDAVDANELGLNATVAGLVDNAQTGKPIVRDTSGMDGPLRPE